MARVYWIASLLLEAVEEVVELLRAEVPRQLGQEVVHVLDDGLVLADLRRPDVVQVGQGKRLLLYNEPYHLEEDLH